MTALALALLSAAGFAGAGLFGLAGSRLPARGRAYATALAAGILLVVAFGDLYPDSLGAAGSGGIVAFIGGFALLFLVEALTHAHTHHRPDESVHEHAIGPFAIGLGLHNLADGFALGVAALLPGGAVGLVGLGVLIHQVPVGLSLAAVTAAAHVPRRTVIGLTLLLGLAIPLAAAAVMALPTPDEWASMIRALKADDTTKGVRLVGYVSHVQVDLKRGAQEAGCDQVLARSALSQNLPQLMRRAAEQMAANERE